MDEEKDTPVVATFTTVCEHSYIKSEQKEGDLFMVFCGKCNHGCLATEEVADAMVSQLN